MHFCQKTPPTDIYHRIIDYSRGLVSHTVPLESYNQNLMNVYKDGKIGAKQMTQYEQEQ